MIPTHRRTITIESFDEDEAYRVEATLTDERPWADDEEMVRVLHHMRLVVLVDRTTLTIADATATMANFPHEECPSIEPAFRALVGLSVTRGYVRNVTERLGRTSGCTHLEFLARAIGPAVIQTMASSAARRVGPAGIGSVVSADTGNWLADSCHLWARGGVGPSKIATGWRPGQDGYPAASLVALRRIRPSSPQ
jgi:Protein of unknown function (DUF2889)